MGTIDEERTDVVTWAARAAEKDYFILYAEPAEEQLSTSLDPLSRFPQEEQWQLNETLRRRGLILMSDELGIAVRRLPVRL